MKWWAIVKLSFVCREITFLFRYFIIDVIFFFNFSLFIFRYFLIFIIGLKSWKKNAFQGISAPIFILFDNIKMLVCSVFGFYYFKFFISTSSNPRQSSSYNEWRWYLFTSLASLPVSYLILHYAIDQTILMFFFSSYDKISSALVISLRHIRKISVIFPCELGDGILLVLCYTHIHLYNYMIILFCHLIALIVNSSKNRSYCILLLLWLLWLLASDAAIENTATHKYVQLWAWWQF